MSNELNKYRLLLGYARSGKYVAAPSPEAATSACFPDVSFHEKNSGRGWVRYEAEQELPESWPHNEEGVTGGGGKILDVEHLGTILVVGDETDG